MNVSVRRPKSTADPNKVVMDVVDVNALTFNAKVSCSVEVPETSRQTREGLSITKIKVSSKIKKVPPNKVKGEAEGKVDGKVQDTEKTDGKMQPEKDEAKLAKENILPEGQSNSASTEADGKSTLASPEAQRGTASVEAQDSAASVEAQDNSALGEDEYEDEYLVSESRMRVLCRAMANYVCACVSSSAQRAKELKKEAIVYRPVDVTASTYEQIDNQAARLMYPKPEELAGAAIAFKQRCKISGYDIATCTGITIALTADNHFKGFYLTEALLHQLSEGEQDVIVARCLQMNALYADFALMFVGTEDLQLRVCDISPSSENPEGDVSSYDRNRYVLVHKNNLLALRLTLLE